MVNIRDVAKKAGVSVATVSRVLNHPDTVSAKTKDIVQSAMKELRYTPNSMARSLTLKRTGTIALLIPNILNPLYPQVAKGVEDVAHQKGYSVLLCNSEDKAVKERDYLEMLVEKRVDGLILTASLLEQQDLMMLQERKINFVMIGKNLPNLPVNTVFTDYYLGAYQATQHLIECGYTKIAHLSGPKHRLESKDKQNGYLKALQDNLMDYEEKYLLEGNNEIEGGYLGAKKLLRLSALPQAIFAANDLMAIGAMDALKTEGIKIPQEMAIVGFDDIRMASLVEPKLTTVSQPVYKMGLLAARLLFDNIESHQEEDYQQKIYLEPKLMVRKSCGREDRVREIFN